MATVCDSALLHGLVALQHGLVDQRELLLAFRTWVAQKEQPIDRLLLEQDLLNLHQLEALDAAVATLLATHHGDLKRSLRGIYSSADVSINELLHQLSTIRDTALLVSIDELREDGAGGGPRSSPIGAFNETPHEASAVQSLCTVADASQDQSLAQSAEQRHPRVPQPGQHRFEILEPIEQGGLGIVSLARDKALNRKVALKQLRADKAKRLDLQHRFIHEAEITGNLEHPGVVPVYALESDENGRPYYVMRLIEGENLKQRIRRMRDSHQNGTAHYTRHALRALLRRFIDVCQVMEYAHSHGVIHRDLKPANVMLGRYGETLLVDWGLAKKVDEPSAPVQSGSPADTRMRDTGSQSSATPLQTSLGTLLGTPAYASPEQAIGDADSIDERSDVFGLGAILYEILTGQPPIAGQTRSELLRKASEGEVRDPRSLNAHVPSSLSAIALKALSKEKDARYTEVKELREDVERWLDYQPVTAEREPNLARIRRWTRRYPTLMVSFVLSLGLGMMSLTGYGLQANRNREALASKNVELRRAATEALDARDEGTRHAAAAKRRGVLAVDSMLLLTKQIRDSLANSAQPNADRIKVLEATLPSLQAVADAYLEDASTDPKAVTLHISMGNLILSAGFEELPSTFDDNYFTSLKKLRRAFHIALDHYDQGLALINSNIQESSQTTPNWNTYIYVLEQKAKIYEALDDSRQLIQSYEKTRELHHSMLAALPKFSTSNPNSNAAADVQVPTLNQHRIHRQTRLIQTLEKLITALLRDGDTEAAEPHLRELFALLDETNGKTTDPQAEHLARVNAEQLRGRWAYLVGDLEYSRLCYERAVAMGKTDAEQLVQSPDQARVFFASLLGAATSHLAMDHFDTATDFLQQLDQATIEGPLASAHPDLARTFRQWCYGQQGQVLSKLGHTHKAAQKYNDSSQLWLLSPKEVFREYGFLRDIMETKVHLSQLALEADNQQRAYKFASGAWLAFEQLCSEVNSEDAPWQWLEAELQCYRAQSMRLMEPNRDAEKTLRFAYDQARSLATSPQTPAHLRRKLLDIAMAWGTMLQQSGRCDEAAAVHEHALAMQRELLALYHAVPDDQHRLQTLHARLAETYTQCERSDEAIESLRVAISTGRAASKRSPRNAVVKYDTAVQLYQLAQLLHRTDQNAEALQAMRASRLLAAELQASQQLPEQVTEHIHRVSTALATLDSSY